MTRSMWVVLVLFALVIAAPRAASAAWTMQQQTQFMAEDDVVLSVAARSDDVGLAFGFAKNGGSQSNAFWYRTSNGGAMWQTAPGPDMMDFANFRIYLDFDFPTSEVGYAVAQGLMSAARVQKTVNGGGAWADQNIAGLAGGVTRVFALDANRVWAITDKAEVARSADGMVWQATTIPGAGATEMRGLFFLDGQRGWVVGGGSEDITEQDMNGNEVLVGVRALAQGVVARTTDGGQTWTALRAGDDAVYEDVAFVDASRGILAGWRGQQDMQPFVMVTSNGGESWSPVTLPPAPGGQAYYSLYRVSCPDAGHCWIVGSAGTRQGSIMNRPVFLFTPDGGATWELQSPDDGMGGVLDVDFNHAGKGWAVGTFNQIWRWDDGSVGPGPGDGGGFPGDGGSWPDGSGMTGPWADIFGVFQNGAVPPVGGGGEPVGPGDEVSPGGDGGVWNPGFDTGGGASGGDLVCTGGDCSAAPQARGAAWPLAIVLAALVFLVLRRRARLVAPLMALLLVAASCGGGETCVPAGGGSTGVDVVAPTDLSTPEPPAPEDGPYCVNYLDAPVPVVPGNAPGAATRSVEGDPRIVVARAAAEGGSDLWLLEPISGAMAQLTFFEDPAVEVWDPAWSPDRAQVVFVSNFNAAASVFESNLFVVGVDGAGCRQVTASPMAGYQAVEGTPMGTVQGFFKRPMGSMGLVVAVPGAIVRSSLGGAPAQTDHNGGFRFQVPAGDGVLFFRLQDGDELIEGSRAYSVTEGAEQNLGDVIADAVAATAHLRTPSWRPDGSGIVFRNETTQALAAGEALRVLIQEIDVDGANLRDLAVADNDRLGVPVYHPLEATLLTGLDVADRDSLFFTQPAPESYEDPELRIPVDGFDRRARVAMSHHRFLAFTVNQGSREVAVVGATPTGDLEQQLRTELGDTSLAWDGLDWSPGGQQIAFTRVAIGGGRDLYLLDVVSGSVRPLLEDGLCRGFAWYGR